MWQSGSSQLEDFNHFCWSGFLPLEPSRKCLEARWSSTPKARNLSDSMAFCLLLSALKFLQISCPLPCRQSTLSSGSLLILGSLLSALTPDLCWHLIQQDRVKGTTGNRCAHLALVNTQEPGWMHFLVIAPTCWSS